MNHNMMAQTRRQVISIIGTTGVGKSQLSIELATRFNGEVINADSMQMYQQLDIITNKHPIPQRNGIKHHVMGHVPWDDEYDMHRFQKEALLLIDDIHRRGKVPIVVGGTHYYLQSLLFTNKTVVTRADGDDDIGTKATDQIKDLTLEQMAVLNGDADELIEHLRLVDPHMANKFHPNDHRRIKRSLEIFYKTGKRASDIYKSQRQGSSSSSSLRFDTLFLWVWSDQATLDPRLDSRVDLMLRTGGMDEIRELYEYYESHGCPDCERGVWQVIGFKEFLPWLRQEAELAKSVEDMKVRTRRYSKRQVKWIKNSLCKSLADDDEDGKIYLLDATNLTNWDSQVNLRAGDIVAQFLQHKPILEPHTPPGLETMIPVTGPVLVVEQRHYHCEVCKDAEGNPLVILAGQWQLHLNGSKHKSVLKKGKRKREYEEWLLQKKANV